MAKNKKSPGFTLIEIMVAISIVAVLAMTGAIMYTPTQQKARDSKRQNDLRALQTALELYYQKNRNFPSTTPTGINSGNRTSWGNLLSADYINTMPYDPKNPTNNQSTYIYYYYSIAGSGSYILCAKMEKLPGTADQTLCPNTPAFKISYP